MEYLLHSTRFAYSYRFFIQILYNTDKQISGKTVVLMSINNDFETSFEWRIDGGSQSGLSSHSLED